MWHKHVHGALTNQAKPDDADPADTIDLGAALGHRDARDHLNGVEPVQISRLVEWRHRECVDSTCSSCSSGLLFKPVGDPCGGGSAKCSIGNEDGAQKIVAGLFQVLNDHGFTIPAQGSTCWNDEAMGSRDFKDLDQTQ